MSEATLRTEVIQVMGAEVLLREMQGQVLENWMQIEVHAAMLRAQFMARTQPTLGLSPIDLMSLPESRAFLRVIADEMETRKPSEEELSQAQASLRQADDVLACLALVNAGVTEAEAPRRVVAMDENARASVVRAQSRLNRTEERAALLNLAQQIKGIHLAQMAVAHG